MFAKCTNDTDRVYVEGYLKKLITDAIANRELYKKDWDNEPMPEFVKF